MLRIIEIWKMPKYDFDKKALFILLKKRNKQGFFMSFYTIFFTFFSTCRKS